MNQETRYVYANTDKPCNGVCEGKYRGMYVCRPCELSFCYNCYKGDWSEVDDSHEKSCRPTDSWVKMETRKKKIQDKLDEIFPKPKWAFSGFASLEAMNEKGFVICFEEHETSFDDLVKISEAFGTKVINFKSETREGGYCETCSYSYSVNLVSVDDVAENWR
jgi:hypothetical protein